MLSWCVFTGLADFMDILTLPVVTKVAKQSTHGYHWVSSSIQVLLILPLDLFNNCLKRIVFGIVHKPSLLEISDYLF